MVDNDFSAALRVIERYLKAPRHVVLSVSDVDHLKNVVMTENRPSS